MFNVFLTNFGFTHSSHKTLQAAITAARKTGFDCHIFRKDDPFTIVKTIFAIRGGR